MKSVNLNQIVQTPYGVAQVTVVDQESKSVKVKHFDVNTPVTDFYFRNLLEPVLTNKQVKNILMLNKIVGKVSGQERKRIEVKYEKDFILAANMFPDSSIVYGFLN